MQMDGVTQGNAAQVEELSGTSQSLAAQAEQLRELVAYFTLREKVVTVPAPSSNLFSPQALVNASGRKDLLDDPVASALSAESTGKRKSTGV